MSSIYEEDLESRLLIFAGERGDNTIVSYLRMGRRSADPIMLTMEKIIYALQKEKETYFKQSVENINNRYPTPLKDLES